MGAIGETHKRKQRPLIFGSRIGILVGSEPSLNLGASCVVELCEDSDQDVCRLQRWDGKLTSTTHTKGANGAMVTGWSRPIGEGSEEVEGP